MALSMDEMRQKLEDDFYLQLVKEINEMTQQNSGQLKRKLFKEVLKLPPGRGAMLMNRFHLKDSRKLQVV